ncbi:hypothetical protein [Acidianus sp. HS-5]|uniref:hypothetical protein n=1 Tax=Acidianus sp. HS-5 TaxID=2886040 RepID=UPI001F44477E|nr:hypothetical protein [Acidianus sp. HS-5]BDC17367.1 hypothetical protein HS5_02570 [Acidianus sp. HS-5]
MNEYIAKYIISKGYRRVGEINIRYVANDDESIKIAKSVCEKLGEEDVEELVVERIIGEANGSPPGKSDDDKLLGTIAGVIMSTLTDHVIDSTITKVVYSKKYPCIRPRSLDDLDKYIDTKRLEEIVNER